MVPRGLALLLAATAVTTLAVGGQARSGVPDLPPLGGGGGGLLAPVVVTGAHDDLDETTAAVTALVLTLGSAGYGYHRDELYFRMLPPAWGYTDQPPLAPFLARASSAVVDEVWALRVPATLACAVSVVLLGMSLLLIYADIVKPVRLGG